MRRVVSLGLGILVLFAACGCEGIRQWSKVPERGKFLSLVSMPLLRADDHSAIAGRVVDAKGAAIYRATVQVRWDRPYERRGAVTDAEGAFSLGDLPQAGYCDIRVEAVGYAPLFDRLEIKAGHRVQCVISLPAGQPVEALYGTAPLIDPKTTAAGADVEIDTKTGEPVAHPF